MHDTNWHWSYGLWLQCIEMVLGKRLLSSAIHDLMSGLLSEAYLTVDYCYYCWVCWKIKFSMSKETVKFTYLKWVYDVFRVRNWNCSQCNDQTECRGVVKGYINTYLVHDYNSLHRKTIRLNGGIESGRRGLYNASPVVHKYWSKC